MKRGILIAGILVVTQLPWDTAAALTVNIGNDHDRQVERREERRREERARERDRDERRRDGRRLHHDHDSDDFHRVLKRVIRDENPPHTRRR